MITFLSCLMAVDMIPSDKHNDGLMSFYIILSQLLAHCGARAAGVFCSSASDCSLSYDTIPTIPSFVKIRAHFYK